MLILQSIKKFSGSVKMRESKTKIKLSRIKRFWKSNNYNRMPMWRKPNRRNRRKISLEISNESNIRKSNK
jgi:hypothetical protein